MKNHALCSRVWFALSLKSITTRCLPPVRCSEHVYINAGISGGQRSGRQPVRGSSCQRQRRRIGALSYYYYVRNFLAVLASLGACAPRVHLGPCAPRMRGTAYAHASACASTGRVVYGWIEFGRNSSVTSHQPPRPLTPGTPAGAQGCSTQPPRVDRARLHGGSWFRPPSPPPLVETHRQNWFIRP